MKIVFIEGSPIAVFNQTSEGFAGPPRLRPTSLAGFPSLQVPWRTSVVLGRGETQDSNARRLLFRLSPQQSVASRGRIEGVVWVGSGMHGVRFATMRLADAGRSTVPPGTSLAWQHNCNPRKPERRGNGKEGGTGSSNVERPAQQVGWIGMLNPPFG